MPNEPYTLDAISARSCACLVTSTGNPVPLEGVDVRSEVFGAHARVVLRQRYRNSEATPIEAIYTFPVPSDAALVGFAMECAGRRIEAEVKEREEAFAAYDDAVSAGHGAALLDEERRNVFTASVGNLLPGEQTVIEVAYVQALRADEGALRFVVPTVVAPRYIPAGSHTDAKVDRTGHGVVDPSARVPDADRISPQIALVDYGFTLDVVFDLGREISIESPSHALRITAERGTTKRVQLKRVEAPLDRDLVLIASAASGAGGVLGASAGVVVDRGAGDTRGTFALTIVPDLFDGAAHVARRDVVFLIDVSGSMGGPPLAQAKAALRLCLRQLSEGDRFRVIAFSDTELAFEAGPTPFDQRSLARADRWIDGLVASGGTEMLAPLLHAVDAFGASSKRDRVVVLMTDGQVGNEAEIVTQVVARASGARIYAFGIGSAVSDLLVADLARRTRGAAEFIHPGERIEDKVTAQFARAIAPRVTHLELVFDDVDADEIAPAELPDLIDGEPWSVYGRYAEPGRGTAKLRGRRDGEPFYLELTCDLLEEANHKGLAQLWARMRIRDLEEAKVEGRRAEANKKRIVGLSIEHGVASKYASFVVVEKRRGARLAHGQPDARPVPVSAPAGWTKSGAAKGGAASGDGYAMARSAPPARAHFASRAMPPPTIPPPGFGPPPGGGAPVSGGRYGAPPQARSAPPMPPPMQSASRPAASAPPSRAAARPVSGGASCADTGSFATMSDARAVSTTAASPNDLFEKQLANGLWGADADGDAAKMLGTARALAAAFAAGIDASHAMFGGQIKKAIDAVIALAPRLAVDAKADDAVMAALIAAYLVASGKRQRDRIVALVATSRWASIAPLFATQEASKRRLAELVS